MNTERILECTIEVVITVVCGTYALAFVSYNMYRFFDWLHRDRDSE